MSATLKLMGLTASRLTPEVTREVCLRTSSTAMLDGSIARLGSRYVIDLQVVAATTTTCSPKSRQRRRTRLQCWMPWMQLP